jgi:hypothetical protein
MASPVETMLPGLRRDKNISIAILEGGALNVQEADGHYNAFSLGKCHVSILDDDNGDDDNNNNNNNICLFLQTDKQI